MENNLPQRKQIRLKYYNYASEGMYFITICTKNREELFWCNNKNKKQCRGGACSAQIQNLNSLGKIIQKEWLELKNRYANVQLDEYIIMPNHIHGIINLTGGASPAPTIGDIICSFKSIATIACNKAENMNGRIIWQRNYYEHIIRNEKEYYKIVEYIRNNPLRWEEDTYFN